MYLIKLNDSKNGLSSKHIKEKIISKYIHKIAISNNIYITDFDYIPDFGIFTKDWLDNLHWTDLFYKKWTVWICNKIKKLFKNKKLLILSDSTIDFINFKSNFNREYYFLNILNKNKIKAKLIAINGSSFTNSNKNKQYINIIKNINKKFNHILIIGGMNDTFSNNKYKIKISINNFSKFAKNLILR